MVTGVQHQQRQASITQLIANLEAFVEQMRNQDQPVAGKILLIPARLHM